MQIVGELGENADLLAPVAEASAEVVITTRQPTGLHPNYSKLLDARSNLTVVAIADEGRAGYVYELQPRERSAGEVAPPLLHDVQPQTEG